MKPTQITLLHFGLLLCLFSVSVLTVLYRWNGIFGRVIANSHTYSISCLMLVGVLCLAASKLRTAERSRFLPAAFACVWIPWLGAVLSYWLMTATWDLKSASQLLQFEEFATTLAMSLLCLT
jgi:hypothetical protein